MDGADAARPPTRPGEVEFSGALVVSTASRVTSDTQNAGLLPAGCISRRGSTDPEVHDPPRTVALLPASETAGPDVVMKPAAANGNGFVEQRGRNQILQTAGGFEMRVHPSHNRSS